MAVLDAAALLRLWEQGQGAAPPERALLLLAAAQPEASPSALAELPLGSRDARLFELRERLFGRALGSLSTCPHCGEQVELDLDSQALRSPEASASELELEAEGCRLRFRLPTGGDLLACADCADAEAAEERLLSRCLLELTRGEAGLGIAELPPAVLALLLERMAAADPGADLELELACPACSSSWRSALDIASFLWTELQDWALRVLREVHLLATAYGWSESEILALSPWRRRFYLEMAAP